MIDIWLRSILVLDILSFAMCFQVVQQTVLHVQAALYVLYVSWDIEKYTPTLQSDPLEQKQLHVQVCVCLISYLP